MNCGNEVDWRERYEAQELGLIPIVSFGAVYLASLFVMVPRHLSTYLVFSDWRRSQHGHLRLFFFPAALDLPVESDLLHDVAK